MIVSDNKLVLSIVLWTGEICFHGYAPNIRLRKDTFSRQHFKNISQTLMYISQTYIYMEPGAWDMEPETFLTKDSRVLSWSLRCCRNLTIIIIMFWDFLMFYQIFYLPEVKNTSKKLLKNRIKLFRVVPSRSPVFHMKTRVSLNCRSTYVKDKKSRTNHIWFAVMAKGNIKSK